MRSEKQIIHFEEVKGKGKNPEIPRLGGILKENCLLPVKDKIQIHFKP